MLKKIFKKYFRGEPTRPKNTLKILPGVFWEYFLSKIEIPKGAAAEGRRPLWGRPQAAILFLYKKYFKNIPGNIFRVFFGRVGSPRKYFLSIF